MPETCVGNGPVRPVKMIPVFIGLSGGPDGALAAFSEITGPGRPMSSHGDIVGPDGAAVTLLPLSQGYDYDDWEDLVVFPWSRAEREDGSWGPKYHLHIETEDTSVDPGGNCKEIFDAGRRFGRVEQIVRTNCCRHQYTARQRLYANFRIQSPSAAVDRAKAMFPYVFEDPRNISTGVAVALLLAEYSRQHLQ